MLFWNQSFADLKIHIFANYHEGFTNHFPDSLVSDICTDGSLEYMKSDF